MSIFELNAQGTTYFFPSSALESFAPSLNNSNMMNDLNLFIKTFNGQALKSENEVFVVDSKQVGFWVYYQHKGVIFCFGPSTSEANSLALGKLRKLISSDNRFKESLKHIDIGSFQLTAGQKIKLGMTALNGANMKADKVGEGFDEQIQAALEKLGTIEFAEGVETSAEDKQTIEEVREAVKQILGNNGLMEQVEQAMNDPANAPGGKTMEQHLGEFSRAMADARAKVGGLSDGDGDSDSAKDGAKGFLKVDNPLDKWFVTLLKILSKIYLQPPMEDLIMQGLALAYLIAPELIENIGNVLGSLQRSLIPDAIDSQLNNIAAIAEIGLQVYDAFKQLDGLFNNPNFKMLMENLSWKDAVKAANFGLDKFNLDLGPLNEIGQMLASGLDAKSFAEGFKNIAYDKMKQLAIDQAKNLLKSVPVLKNFDYNTLFDASGKLKLDPAKLAEDLVCPELNQYAGACTAFTKGGYKAATKKAVASTVSKYSKIPATQIEGLVNAFEKGDAKAGFKAMSDIGFDQISNQTGIPMQGFKRVWDKSLEGDKLNYKDFFKVAEEVGISFPQPISTILENPNEIEKQFKRVTAILTQKTIDSTSVGTDSFKRFIEKNWITYSAGLESKLTKQGLSATDIDKFKNGKSESVMTAQLKTLATGMGLNSDVAFKALLAKETLTEVLKKQASSQPPIKKLVVPQQTRTTTHQEQKNHIEFLRKMLKELLENEGLRLEQLRREFGFNPFAQ
jgi:hypothetical protein